VKGMERKRKGTYRQQRNARRTC